MTAQERQDHQDRQRFALSTGIAIALFGLLYAGLLGTRWPSSDKRELALGTPIAVVLQPESAPLASTVTLPSLYAGAGAASSGASSAGITVERTAAAASSAPPAASAPTASGAVSSLPVASAPPSNPFALPPEAQLPPGQTVVAASGGSLEADRVVRPAPALAQGAPAQAALPAPAPNSASPDAVTASSASSYSGGGASPAPFGASQAGSSGQGTFGSTTSSAGSASGAMSPSPVGPPSAAGGAGSSAQKVQSAPSGPPSIFNPAIVSQLGQLYGSSGGGAASGTGGTSESSGGADAGSSAKVGAGDSGGADAIRWDSGTAQRTVLYMPPKPDLKPYYGVLPPKIIVTIRFSVSPGGLVSSSSLYPSTGSPEVDNLLSQWMAQWRFQPAGGSQSASGSIDVPIVANTVR